MLSAMTIGPTDEAPDAAPNHLPGTGRHRAMLLPRSRTTPRAARDFVVAALTEWGETSRLDDIRVCTSELVTNALLHGTPAGRMILVSVEVLDEQVRIEVHDAREEAPVQRAPADSAVDGRGLLIVSTTADSWGTTERVGPGKCVWATFQRATGGAAPLSAHTTGQWASTSPPRPMPPKRSLRPDAEGNHLTPHPGGVRP
ncbi:hypothetical protein GCM10018772_50410 [Streptomyces fumanus]|uniref:Histidine kinase/HSP90-like ATPase domain-containing protein n=2 Tax=Streptomyces fumanus TaxID=67302 RepID=A0A919AQ75_9ACTN|nr:hypothetical protein GCM10018772_50410 [Streptomyces fumanus]